MFDHRWSMNKSLTVFFIFIKLFRRSDKDKMRPHPYRKEDPARFLDRTSGIRGAPIRSAPVREVRDHVSPSWEPNERRDTKTRVSI